ncbi:polysaccharide deacetylase family protein [Leptospira stimsonii]|uniref:Polysaccharide deacetylase n=1 Tax=Leptospira stimsonii TaxID=2202203 RepID=A0A8B6RYB0_9LEPT|nr:polysaccharide deacetylase family protein [Leptospira stimsonii]RHX85889.1 polysaccharide deacetylase [Leptospira stimsonii]
MNEGGINMYYQGPWPSGFKGVLALGFDVDLEYAYTKETHTMGFLPRIFGFDRLLAGSRLVNRSRGMFGLNVGLPRVRALLKEFEIPATFFVPSAHVDRYPKIFRSIQDDGHEIGAHGHEHESLALFHGSPKKEAGILHKIDGIFRNHLGKSPAGYRSPSWDMNDHTPTLLVEAGYKYDSSLFGGQAPYPISTKKEAYLLEIPIDWSQDDAPYFLFLKPPIMFAQFHDPRSVFEIWKTELDSVINEGGVMTITCHPSIIGRFHRLQILRQLIQHARERGDIWITSFHEIATHVDRMQHSNSTRSEVPLSKIE